MAKVSSSQLRDLFMGLYDEEVKIKQTRKGISEELKSFASDNDVSLKALKLIFGKYKSWKDKGGETEDDDDFYTLLEVYDEMISGD
jgi:hypothetical protein